MSINYFMTARQTEEIMTVNVELTCEFQQGTSPKMVNFNGNGQISDAYANISGIYDTEKSRFQNINGMNIPEGFVGELETKIKAFKSQIDSDQA